MLKFETRTNVGTTLKTIGTVSEFVGVGGSYAPSSARNLGDESKRVSILLTNAEGGTALVNCSKPVSADLRSKKLRLEDLGALNILEIPIDSVDPTTGEIVKTIMHCISYDGGSDRSAVTVNVTETMINSNPIARSVNWGELIAL